MKIINYTVSQDEKHIGNVAVREQAVNAAKKIAAQTEKPVSIVAHTDEGKDLEIMCNPDGYISKIWKIEQGNRFTPEIGEIYHNNGGGSYRCLWSSDTGATFINTKSGWKFSATDIIRYSDGSIEWAWSSGGQFVELEEEE